MELAELTENCKKGDKKSYEFLYKKYYRVLYGISIRYCRTTFEAEDILQEVFIKIFKNIQSFNMQGSFEGWLKRIVQNTAINHYQNNLKFNQNSDITKGVIHKITTFLFFLSSGNLLYKFSVLTKKGTNFLTLSN